MQVIAFKDACRVETGLKELALLPDEFGRHKLTFSDTIEDRR